MLQRRPTGSVWIKQLPNNGAKFDVSEYSATLGNLLRKTASMYSGERYALYGLDPNYGGLNIDAGTVYVPCKTAVAL